MPSPVNFTTIKHKERNTGGMEPNNILTVFAKYTFDTASSHFLAIKVCPAQWLIQSVQNLPRNRGHETPGRGRCALLPLHFLTPRN